MREAFEKWAIKTAKQYGYRYMDIVLNRDGEGEYTQSWVDSAWMAWQACWEYRNDNH